MMFETISNTITDSEGNETTYESLMYTDEDGNVWSVPQDPQNVHYQKYLAQL